GLRYRGRVGSGLDDESIAALVPKLAALATPEFPGFGGVPAESKDAHWVKPELVVSVRFQGFTPDAHLRHPVFRGVRTDIEPAQCRAMPPEELLAEPAPPVAVETNEAESSAETEAEAAPRAPAKSRVNI